MKTILRWSLCVALLVMSGVSAFAGTLRLGAATYEGENVTFPVILDGETSTGASTIMFSLSYDSNVLEPAGNASTGAAAAAADKLVQSNVPAPGEYKVIMMGMNQSVLNSGEIATITMKIKDPGAGQANLEITNTSIASPEGAEIPSEGSSDTIKFSDANNPEKDPEQDQNDDQTNDETTDDDPQQPTEDGAGDTPTPVVPSDPSSPTQQPTTPGVPSAGATGEPQQMAKAQAAAPGGRIAAAITQADSARQGIATPSAALENNATGAASGDAAKAQTAGTDATATAPEGTAATTAPGTDATAASPIQTANAATVGAAPIPLVASDSTAVADAAAAPAAAEPKSTMKFVLFGVIAVVLVGVFFVRRKFVS